MKFLLALLVTPVAVVAAEDSIVIRTNYYAVSGATSREVRGDIVQKRPWKSDNDGYTAWKIDWSFTTASSEAECHLESFQTRTAITITLPRWVPSPEAEPEFRENWTGYFQDLSAHEEGHKRIALAAAKELRKKVNGIGSAVSCAELQTALNRVANQVINDFKQREKAYDAQTDHGRRAK